MPKTKVVLLQSPFSLSMAKNKDKIIPVSIKARNVDTSRLMIDVKVIPKKQSPI